MSPHKNRFLHWFHEGFQKPFETFSFRTFIDEKIPTHLLWEVISIFENIKIKGGSLYREKHFKGVIKI